MWAVAISFVLSKLGREGVPWQFPPVVRKSLPERARASLTISASQECLRPRRDAKLCDNHMIGYHKQNPDSLKFSLRNLHFKPAASGWTTAPPILTVGSVFPGRADHFHFCLAIREADPADLSPSFQNLLASHHPLFSFSFLSGLHLLLWRKHL